MWNALALECVWFFITNHSNPEFSEKSTFRFVTKRLKQFSFIFHSRGNKHDSVHRNRRLRFFLHTKNHFKTNYKTNLLRSSTRAQKKKGANSTPANSSITKALLPAAPDWNPLPAKIKAHRERLRSLRLIGKPRKSEAFKTLVSEASKMGLTCNREKCWAACRTHWDSWRKLSECQRSCIHS